MTDLLVVCALTLVAAAVQGFFGFGFGIVAMSTLTLSRDLVHAAGVVNLTAILLSLAMLRGLHAHVLWPLVWRIVPATFLGIAIGLGALSDFDRELMVGFLGVTVIGVAGLNLLAPRLRHRESSLLDVAVGLVAGVLSGAFNTGGPPLVIHLYRRPEPPLALVLTLQAIFLSSGVVRAVLSASQGLLSAEMGFDALVASPFVVGGALLGAAMARRTAPERFRRAAWLGLGALGVALLASR